MRIFKSILCTYILLLALLPCGDFAHADDARAKENTHIAESPAQEDDCDGDKDSCSIFCQCSASCSCSGNFLGSPRSYQAHSTSFPAFKSILTVSYSVSPSKGFPGSSWRPPQV